MVLNNSGTISDTGGGAGVGIGDSLSGTATITNSGTISGVGSYSSGLFSSSNITSLSVLNTATGTITGGWAGIQSWSAANDITNYGSIIGTGEKGIFVGNSGNATIRNYGTISGATYGILMQGGNAIVTNSGTITGTDTGISMTAGTLTLTNSGTIKGTTNYGVYIAASGSTITNSGTISGGQSAVYLKVGSNTINIYTGAIFTNGIDYNSTTGNTTNFYTGSYTLGVKNYLVSSNTINTLVSGTAVVTSALNSAGTGNIYVVDTAPANIASSSAPLIARFTSSIVSDIVAQDIERPALPPSFRNAKNEDGMPPELTDQVRSAFGDAFALHVYPTADLASHKLKQGQVMDEYGNLVWSRSFFGTHLQTATSTGRGQYTNYYGSMLGYDRQIEAWRLGGYIGYGSLKTSLLDSSGTLSNAMYFGGVYGRRDFGPFVFDALLSGGLLSNTSWRSVNNGSESAKGTFNGVFIAPELALGYNHVLSEAWTVTPTLRGRYVGAFFSGYTESGSSQNVTYGDNSTHSLEERLELRLSHKEKHDRGLISTFYVETAALATQRIGSDSFTATLLGTGFTVSNPYARSSVGASLGLGFDHQVTDQLTLFGGLNGTLFTDSSTALGGRAGLKVAF